MSLHCEFCKKKLHDEKNPNKWTEFNIAQHIKYCKSRPSEKPLKQPSLFFSKLFGKCFFY